MASYLPAFSAALRTAKARLEAFEDLRDRVANGRVSTGEVEIQGEMSRLGSAIVTLDGVSVSVGGKRVLHKFSYEFLRRDKVGIGLALPESTLTMHSHPTPELIQPMPCSRS